MKVWGIGFNWHNDSAENNRAYTDKSKEFINNSIAVIGWSQEQAPGLYSMASEVEVGDILYLKSYIIRGSKIRVKAIGTVIDNAFVFSKYPNQKVFNVNWINTDEFKIQLTNKERINNIFRNTLYREYNPTIIKEIISRIEE